MEWEQGYSVLVLAGGDGAGAVWGYLVLVLVGVQGQDGGRDGAGVSYPGPGWQRTGLGRVPCPGPGQGRWGGAGLGQDGDDGGYPVLVLAKVPPLSPCGRTNKVKTLPSSYFVRER